MQTDKSTLHPNCIMGNHLARVNEADHQTSLPILPFHNSTSHNHICVTIQNPSSIDIRKKFDFNDKLDSDFLLKSPILKF